MKTEARRATEKVECLATGTSEKICAERDRLQGIKDDERRDREERAQMEKESKMVSRATSKPNPNPDSNPYPNPNPNPNPTLTLTLLQP